ncbi:endonuclease V [Bhargavaea ullalensis]|uniref:Endonuclease V n=1 Tax=Bhargavaea ullalensis TaxID=1265685 RepID=A0ABV2G9K7_9BACL
MEIHLVHPVHPRPDEFVGIQEMLRQQVRTNRPLTFSGLSTVAGVDIAYGEQEGMETGFCHIALFKLPSMEIIERAESQGPITVPYMPGFLTFRELPLILDAAQKLQNVPDLFMFDGNGILHPRRMGIATHASFFLGKPTIGIAKTYFKVGETEYLQPAPEKGSFTDIIVGGEPIGRAVRTSAGVKPVFVSPGNQIDLSSATDIALQLTGPDSRIPVPVREADIQTRNMRRR